MDGSFRRRFISRFASASLCLLFATNGAFAAEITGRLEGDVSTTGGAPLADAAVSVQSPAESLTTTTDAHGHYSFISLTPGAYALTARRSGYADLHQSDLTVQADITKTDSFALSSDIREIGHVSARSRGSLVQPGVTSDVYSIGPAAQQASKALGGGTDRDSIMPSLASVPGLFVPIGQSGWGQSVFIRGGDYNQTGFELDGVPLNRPFDQYSQSPLSSLGASELQVYTGSAPIDQQTEGIGGYVNEVVKTGTYPGFANADVGIGGPSMYNRASIEAGGANGPDKRFTYYVGLQGDNFNQRIIDQTNGSSYTAQYGSVSGVTSGGCGPNNPGPCYPNGGSSNYIGGLPIQPNGYTTLPTFFGQEPAGSETDAIANLHFAIPHKHDAERDDVQFLYANSQTLSSPNASIGALGPAVSTLPVAPYYIDQNYYTGPLNAFLNGSQLGNIANAYYAGHDGAGVYDAPVSSSQADTQTNGFTLAKVSYQHTIGTKAFARLSLYTETSNEIDNGLVGTFQPFFAGPEPPNYILHNMTNGLDASFTDQLGSKHLANLDIGRSFSQSSRTVDYVAGLYPQSPIALLVNANDPTGGCYGVSNGAPELTDCATGGAAAYVLPPIANASAGYVLQPSAGSPTLANAAALTCGTGPCAYYSVSDGGIVNVNAVKPSFSHFSIGDHWDLTKKLTADLGLRFDDFHYRVANTDTSSNELFVNTYNQLNCINGTSIVAKSSPSQACSDIGAGYAPTNLTAVSHDLDYQEISPRIGAAYASSPYDVVRASIGKFVQAAPAAEVQSTFEQAAYPDPNFYSYFGFNSPTRDVQPEVSENIDASWEHLLKDQKTSFKLSPFMRKTTNELTTIPIDAKTGFVAYVNGLNRQTSGFELAIKHGDFQKNGFSGALAYTYSHSTATYPTTASGGSFVAGANQGIQTFNGYTHFCASNPRDARCPNVTTSAGPCFTMATAANGALTASGVATSSCGSGTIANPYWNAAPESLLDPNASYVPFNEPLGAGAGGQAASFDVPHVAALILNYRHNRFAATPSFQYQAGARYGSPLAAQGVAPDSCTAGLNGTTAGDPRYGPGTSAGGSPYDASSCYKSVAIPDPYTGHFDSVGEFRQPSVLTMNLQLTYQTSPTATFELTAVNLIYRCFGGSKVPWSDAAVGCNYAQAVPFVGNFYNPGDSIQPIAQFPYTPSISQTVQDNTGGPPLPFQIYADMKFRL